MSESEGETEMMHFPNHVREAFINWVDDGFPEIASLEVNYEPVQEPADAFLRRFVHCSDILPSYVAAGVAEHIGFDENPQGMTYAIASTVLLVARAVDDAAAVAVLEKLFVAE